jgi:hypothetical protein
MSSSADVDRTEVQGGRAGIGKVSPLVDGKANSEGSRRLRLMAIVMEDTLNVIHGEDGVIANLENVTTKETTVGSVLGVRAEGAVEGGDGGTKVMGATAGLETKRVCILGTKDAGNVMNVIKRRQWNVELVGIIEVDSIEFQIGVAKILNIGRRIRRIHHTFVERDMSGLLDLTSSIVKIQSVLEGFAVAKKDARSSMNVKFDIAFMGRKGIDTTTENA